MFAVETNPFYTMEMSPKSPEMWNGCCSAPGQSLDEIVTAVYGSQYVGQQTGDMLPNDSHHLYKMDKGTVEEWAYLSTPEDEYSVDNQIKRWLYIPDGKYFPNDFQKYRQAPTPENMLAVLIRDGHLPYGNYLLHCWW